MRFAMKHAGGWSLIEIMTLLVMLALMIGGLYSLFQSQGLSGGLKWLGILLLIFIPLMGVIIWKNERDNKRLRQRLKEKSKEGSKGTAGD